MQTRDQHTLAMASRSRRAIAACKSQIRQRPLALLDGGVRPPQANQHTHTHTQASSFDDNNAPGDMLEQGTWRGRCPHVIQWVRRPATAGTLSLVPATRAAFGAVLAKDASALKADAFAAARHAAIVVVVAAVLGDPQRVIALAVRRVDVAPVVT